MYNNYCNIQSVAVALDSKAIASLKTGILFNRITERSIEMGIRILKYLFDDPVAEQLNLIITKESDVDRLLKGLMSGSAIKIVE